MGFCGRSHLVQILIWNLTFSQRSVFSFNFFSVMCMIGLQSFGLAVNFLCLARVTYYLFHGKISKEWQVALSKKGEISKLPKATLKRKNASILLPFYRVNRKSFVRISNNRRCPSRYPVLHPSLAVLVDSHVPTVGLVRIE